MGNRESVDDFATKVMLLVRQVRGLGEKTEETQVVKRLAASSLGQVFPYCIGVRAVWRLEEDDLGEGH